MIIDCPNSQFISRNIVEIADVIIRFRELNSCYSDNLALYLDATSWEVFDVRRSIVLIRHEFKHVRQLLEDMKQYKNDFVNLGVLNYSLSHSRTIKHAEAISVKRLYKVYGDDNYLFNNSNLKKYIYGKFEKTNID